MILKSLPPIIALLAISFGCQEERLTTQESPSIKVDRVTEDQFLAISRWYNNQGTRSEQSYNLDQAYQYTETSTSNAVITAPDASGDGALILFPDAHGTIINSLESKVRILEDGGHRVDLFLMDGSSLISYVDYSNGTRNVLGKILSFGKTEDCNTWYCHFSECIRMTHAPFGDGFSDLIFSVTANYTTMGMYSGASVLVCASYGIFK